MSILRNLIPGNRRGIEDPTVPISSPALVQLMGGGGMTVAGVSVTQENAYHMAAVWRALSLISGVTGALPLKAYRQGSFEAVQNNLVTNPHPEMTPLEFWGLSAVHRGTWGNFYAQKLKNSVGATQWLWPISPSRVKVTRITQSSPKFGDRYLGMKLFAVSMEDGTTEAFSSDDIFHVPHMSMDGLVGVSPIEAARLAIGVSKAAEEYGGRLFGSGNLASGVLQTEARLKEEDAEALKAKWEAKVSGLAKSHGTVIIDSGASFQQLTMPNSDAQFLESRQFQILEIGRFFGVPPFLMMETERSTSWGTGLEQQSLGWLSFDMAPRWLDPLAARLTKEMTGSGIEARYDMAPLMRGDSSARGNFYRIMREIGALNADEIRGYEGLPPLPDGSGKIYLTPANMQTLSGSASKIPPDLGADKNKDGKPDPGPGVSGPLPNAGSS